MGTVAEQVEVVITRHGLAEQDYYVRNDEDYPLATILLEQIGMRKAIRILAAALGIALALITAAAVLSWVIQ